MNLTPRSNTYLLIAILSALFSYLLVTFNYFPHLGMALSLTVFALFSYNLKKDKTKDTTLFLTFSLLFSLLIFVRSEPFTTFLNLLGSLFFGSLMLFSNKLEKPSFIEYTFGRLMLFVQSVFTKSDYTLEFNKEVRGAKSNNTIETILGVAISFFVLAVILPLLSSANPFFEKLMLNLLKIINLDYWLKNLNYEIFFLWTLRIIFFLTSLFFMPKILTLINQKKTSLIPGILKFEPFSLTIPKVAVAVTLSIFFVTQIQYYFASSESLTELGISYSQRAREVFAQLSLVAALVFGLIYNDKNSKSRKILTWTLAVEGIFLVIMAFKSVFEYIGFWGLTYKRLYGVGFATWVLGIFIFFLNSFSKNDEKLFLVRKIVIFTGVILLVINILNFDYLIYHFRKASTGEGIDYTFLSTLSPDSLSYKEQFYKLEEEWGNDGYALAEYNNKNPLMLIWKIENLQKKYTKFDFRTLNLLDFTQYNEIKNINTGKLKSELQFFSFPSQKPHF